MLLLSTLPAPLHRLLYKAAHRLRTLVWRALHLKIAGVRVLAIDGKGRVLLVRHSYGSQAWMAPGGGLGRNEDPLEAAVRELAEETGCRLCDPALVDRRVENLHGARNHVRVVAGRTADAPSPDGREIVEARFFAPDALPQDMPRGHREALPGWLAAYGAASRPRQPQ